MDEYWVGLLTRQSIIDQLAHTAALGGFTPQQLTDDLSAWVNLAAVAFGLDDSSIRAAVTFQLQDRVTP